uniref:Uncharacterized protein n=1 Tax=Arundo donax TaxID=35708 RepID=A0A0A9A8B3_ARUDO
MTVEILKLLIPEPHSSYLAFAPLPASLSMFIV